LKIIGCAEVCYNVFLQDIIIMKYQLHLSIEI